MKRVLLVLFLAGCAAPQGNMYDAAQAECRNLGFTPGTDNFANCVQRDVQNRRDMAIRMIYGR